MDHGPDNLTGLGAPGLGLRFLNDEWNDSISNGQEFTIRWNESLNGALAPELGLFKMTYPRDGVVAYELVSNLTDYMNNDNASCVWTPNNLDDDLYTLWLSSSRDAHSNWTVSPPWRLKELPRYPFPAAPVIVPLVVLLILYTMSLTTCVIYRRRKRIKHQKQQGVEDPAPRRVSDRHGSVDTIITVQTLDDSREDKKQNLWLLTQSPSGSLLLSPSSPVSSNPILVAPRSPAASYPTLVSPNSPAASDPTLVTTPSSSEPTLISPTSPFSDVNLLTPMSTSSDRTLVAPTNPREQRVARAERQGRTVRVVIPTD